MKPQAKVTKSYLSTVHHGFSHDAYLLFELFARIVMVGIHQDEGMLQAHFAIAFAAASKSS